MESADDEILSADFGERRVTLSEIYFTAEFVSSGGLLSEAKIRQILE